jgi:hypothetical protein
LHKEKYIYFALVCCVLCELRGSVLALGWCKAMGRGGGEGRFSSCVAAAVEREVSISYFFSLFFDMSPMGHSA